MKWAIKDVILHSNKRKKGQDNFIQTFPKKSNIIPGKNNVLDEARARAKNEIRLKAEVIGLLNFATQTRAFSTVELYKSNSC